MISKTQVTKLTQCNFCNVVCPYTNQDYYDLFDITNTVCHNRQAEWQVGNIKSDIIVGCKIVWGKISCSLKSDPTIYWYYYYSIIIILLACYYTVFAWEL